MHWHLLQPLLRRLMPSGWVMSAQSDPAEIGRHLFCIGVAGLRECGIKYEHARTLHASFCRISPRKAKSIYGGEPASVSEPEVDFVISGLGRAAAMVARHLRQRAEYWETIDTEIRAAKSGQLTFREIQQWKKTPARTKRVARITELDNAA